MPNLESKTVNLTLVFNISPEIPKFDSAPQSTLSTLQVNGLPIRMEEAITNIAKRLTAGKIASYFDPDRELKTLINFGEDTQRLLTNWMKDPANLANHGILAKLYEPLPINIDPKSLLWISRELSPTLLDQIAVVITPEQQIILYLRSPNRDAAAETSPQVQLTDVTLADLLVSGSTTSGSQVIASNPTLEQWYTTALEGVYLNVDYTDYNNFVHFSSAENRLQVFRQKLLKIEQLQSALNVQSAAAVATLFSSSLSNVSGTAQFKVMQSLADQQQDIVRGFDGYERFLYYNSGSFTGSLSGLDEDEVLEIADVSWPKSTGSIAYPTGSVLPVTHSLSVAFYDAQSAIATDYDRQNAEWLVLNVPEYIQNDPDSAEFLTFLNIVGHHFDTLKLYIDQMPEIYDRGADPDAGISPDLLWTLAQSLGIDLPNQYAIKNLVDFTVGRAAATQKTYSQAITETWKRFIHNQVYIAKTKGTLTGLLALRNVYGVLPQLVRIQESATPSSLFTTGSFELFDELTSVLTFNSGARVEVPFSATGQDPDVVELRFRDTEFASGTLMTAYDSTPTALWSVLVKPTGSADNGRGVLQVVTDAVVYETPKGDFLSGDYFTLMLRRTTAGPVDLTVKSYEDERFTYAHGPVELSGSLSASWDAAVSISLGDGLYSGSVDELRVWSEVTTDATFDDHVRFPGLYAGNSFSSSTDSLVVRHSFNVPRDLTVTQSVTNETPWSGAIGALSESVAVGFDAAAAYPYQFEWIVRQTQRFSANAGGEQYSSNNITIAPSADYKPGTVQVTGSNQIPVLSRDRRIRAIPSGSTTFPGDEIKQRSTIGFYLTLAESINDSIMRSMGQIDLSQLIGDPLNLYEEKYVDLISRYEYYVNNYSPTFNYNKFAKYTDGLLDGLFAQSRANIPASAKLITGVAIEPPILERAKIVLNKPLKVEGSNTRREADARNILATEGSYPGARYAEAEIEETGLPTPLADMKQLLTTIEEISREVLSDITLLNPLLSVEDITIPYAFITQLNGLVEFEDEFTILAIVPSYSTTIDADIIGTASSSLSDQFNFQEIKAESSFDDPLSTTYFTHPSGSYGLLDYEFERIRENILTDRGAWVRGTLYRVNDMVTISGSEYRCLTDKVLSAAGNPVPFVSYVAPNLDTKNWTNVTYRQVPVLRLFKAVVSGSSPIGIGGTTIVPFGQTGYTPFTGYAPQHFKFFRNTATGWVNARYDGCLQTAATTTDGKDPVEVFPSSEAQLFVKEGRSVQDDTDEDGPILTVR